MNDTKCIVCGGIIPEGMTFCPHCLTVLTEENIVKYEKKKSGTLFLYILLACTVVVTITLGVMYIFSVKAFKGNLTPDELVNQIKSNCSENNYKYFNVSYSNFRTSENSGKYTLSFTDDCSGDIKVEFDEEVTEVQIECKLYDTTQSQHAKEILDCLGEEIFGEKLGDCDDTFSAAGYDFSLNTLIGQMEDLSGYTTFDYILNAEKS